MVTKARVEELGKVFEAHPEIEDKLKDIKTVDDFRAIVADYNCNLTDEDVDELFQKAISSTSNGELNEADLEQVAGGGLIKSAWRWGARLGMGIRMVYDYCKTGNPQKTYSIKDLKKGTVFY